MSKLNARTASPVRAVWEVTVDVPNIAANSEANVDIVLPRRFRLGAPVIVEPIGDLPTGILLSHPRVEGTTGGRKLRLRLRNTTAAAIDPAPQKYRITQF